MTYKADQKWLTGPIDTRTLTLKEAQALIEQGRGGWLVEPGHEIGAG